MSESALLQDFALIIDEAFLGAPQHQRTDGVGEAAAGDGLPFPFQLDRGRVVGGEEDVERCALSNLGIELAGGAERERGLVARVLLERHGDVLRRRGEIGGDRDLDFTGMGKNRRGKRDCARSKTEK